MKYLFDLSLHFLNSSHEMVTMKKIAITITLLLSLINLYAQSESSHMKDDANLDLIVGKCERIELQKGEFGNYFIEEYKNYKPDRELLENIKNKFFNCSITIVLGTWCHDSQEQVPRFIKILDDVDYNTNYLEVICVDKEKIAGDYDISALNIEKVPTFIFYKNDKEVGRIIETPSNTLEIDVNNIVNK